ncbi:MULTISPECIES: DUF4177 domain-containing protein [Arthrobacter]|uniref:DUF4177 domain-containing protein n=1 Tax=Arthrobacter TaxID=1663 RepID=UPI001F50FDB1|nr:DUF4177 domain-containing protein [Arthrobacter bambusae]
MASNGRKSYHAQYVVLQVILKEKLWGTGSGNLTSLEKAINDQAAKGYRLHTVTTASSGSKGIGGRDRIQAIREPRITEHRETSGIHGPIGSES